MLRNSIRSESSAIPPLATIGVLVTAQTSRSKLKFGPARVPSLLTSVSM